MVRLHTLLSRASSDFQQELGFQTELQRTTTREIATVVKKNRRYRVITGLFGAGIVFTALELLFTPLTDMQRKYFRVYRCNFQMLRLTGRVTAVQRFLEEEKSGGGINWFYHLHLLTRLTQLCEREKARAAHLSHSLMFSATGLLQTLSLLCSLYREMSGERIHKQLLQLMQVLVTMAQEGHLDLKPEPLWEVMFFLLNKSASDRSSVLYLTQKCVEMTASHSILVTSEAVTDIIEGGKWEDEVEKQAIKDTLTLLLLKKPSILTSSHLKSLQSHLLPSNEQDLFLQTYWPRLEHR